MRPSEIDIGMVYYIPNGKSRHYDEDRHFGTYEVYSNKEQMLYSCHVVAIGRVKRWAITYECGKAYVILDRMVLVKFTTNYKTRVWVPLNLLTLDGAGDTKAWIRSASEGAKVVSKKNNGERKKVGSVE